jgi:hypothetical protein
MDSASLSAKGLHAVSPHKNSSVADIEKYTKGRDVVNHADDCNQILEIPVSHSFRSVPSLGNANRGVYSPPSSSLR